MMHVRILLHQTSGRKKGFHLLPGNYLGTRLDSEGFDEFLRKAYLADEPFQLVFLGKMSAAER